MILNNKIDDFKFNELFYKRIDNLENNYQTFLINKKKKEAREAKKKRK